MPDDIDLKSQLMARHLAARPATGNPSIDRAMFAMDKIYPDVHDVQAEPMWGPEMYSNILGRTPITKANTIMVNPLHAALSPQSAIDETVAHELEHTRQFKADPLPQDKAGMSDWALRQQLNKPYDQRRPEIEAEAAASRYSDQRIPDKTHEGIIPSVANDFYKQLHDSPLVEQIIKRLNGTLK